MFLCVHLAFHLTFLPDFFPAPDSFFRLFEQEPSPSRLLTRTPRTTNLENLGLLLPLLLLVSSHQFHLVRCTGWNLSSPLPVASPFLRHLTFLCPRLFMRKTPRPSCFIRVLTFQNYPLIFSAALRLTGRSGLALVTPPLSFPF